MAVSNKGIRVAVVVTKQPCQRHHQQTLTETVDPKAATGLGDWPALPRPPAEYVCRDGNRSYRHQHEEALAAKYMVVGWGLQWWTIGMLVSDCLVGQIPKARRDFQASANPVSKSSGSSSGASGGASGSSGGSSSADEKSLANKKKLSDYTLIATVQVLLGSNRGTTGSRRVTFNTVPEIKCVDKCRVLYPPTLEGMEIKREAFWSKRETRDNQAKWEGHLESHELGRDGNASACKCHGCAVDGEETSF